MSNSKDNKDDQLTHDEEQELKKKKDDESDDDQDSDTDSDDEPRYIKIIKDDTKADDGMDNETRARLLSNVKDDLVKTDRKISDVISDEGQQEKDLRKFESEKENRIKRIISDKKETRQEQRTRIDIGRRVSELFFGKKNPQIPPANNQQRLLATGLTANDVTVKDKELKHKILEQKHHGHDHNDSHHDNSHPIHGSKLTFADLIRSQQHNHDNEGGGRSH